MILFLGLLSWLLLGLLVGLFAARFLPGRPKLSAGSTVWIGMGAALVGGLISSWFGFGGLATYDPRALATALLTSLLALTWWRIAKLTA